MNHLQTQSIRIHKKTRNTKTGERNYTCGGCYKAYKSYPALYLHIKLKHKGIKPPNTNYQKSHDFPTVNGSNHHSLKIYPEADIDDIPETALVLETVEDELFGMFGDDLQVISLLDIKPTLESVANQIIEDLDGLKDDYLAEIKSKIKEFLASKKKELSLNHDLELDYETVKENGPKEESMMLVWFILWFGKNTLKQEFMPDLCLIFSRILKVLRCMGLEMADLDNKLVWKEITKECQLCKSDLMYFKNDTDLLGEFIKKICEFIGKTLDE